ncbi:MAG: lipase maturation factor family protein [Bdellovibrio sp.]
METLFSQDYVFTRLIFQKTLGFIYLVAFLIAALQSRGLMGEHGILPAKLYLARTTFAENPSLFYFYFSDIAMVALAWIGVALSILAISGFADSQGYFLSMTVWAVLWFLYMSFVNIGQTFYGFGWEILLLEAGFLAIFLGPHSSPVPLLIIWLYRWLAFRVMFGAGLIKIRGDDCWRDMTCMYYHYETQPLPGPLSWHFHHLPKVIQRFSVWVNHYVELIAPFGLFGPGIIRYIAGISTILFQLTIFAGGNYSWLNCISIAICIPCFDDKFLSYFINLPDITQLPPATWHMVLVCFIFAVIVLLSYQPAMNLFSKNQAMNRNYDPLNLVNTYGAFGSITRDRYEIIIEGTSENIVTPTTTWRAYEFKGKPGDPRRWSPQVSPYHFKLDWQMWFAAMSDYRYHPWIISFVGKLLQGNPQVLGLLKEDPFHGHPPQFIRAELYLYKYTDPGEPGMWKRTKVSEYLPPLTLRDETFKLLLQSRGWWDQ